MQRILFIDDDVLALQLMSQASTILNVPAILSTSPRRGLRIAADEKPALVIVDMQMDEMDGVEFIRRVRSAPEMASLPVVLCSASGNREMEARARLAGADAVVQKPIRLAQLSAMIETYTTLL